MNRGKCPRGDWTCGAPDCVDFDLCSSGETDVRSTMEILAHYYKMRSIVEHRAEIDSASLWRRIGHALLVSWRCQACKAFKRGDHLR